MERLNPERMGKVQVAKLSPNQEAVLTTLVEENNDAIKARAIGSAGVKCWRTYQLLHNRAIRIQKFKLTGAIAFF